ncbi:unnamed protein product [Orchesella dallaii]|uniref:Condensin complex subunit 1 C-terminal domain-containing protein n=1 Tax=Orchesella dallaii TaxID=48710 RepID=A0ABP1Q613_9HEXA
MDVQEIKNFLEGEGERTYEVERPTIDIDENFLVEICDSIESDGLEVLISNVGSIANTFKTSQEYSCSPNVLEEAVKIIHQGLLTIQMLIESVQGDVKTSMAQVNRQTKHKLRKYMAVLFFLIYKAFVEIERAVAAEAHNLSIANAVKDTSKRGKKKPDYDQSQYRFWLAKWRPRIVAEVLKVVSPPMHEIWEGATDGINIMRCLTLAFCTTIKSKATRLRELDDELEDIFDILGILATKHQEEKGILTRLIPLLKGSEETGAILGNGLDRMITNMTADEASSIVLRALSEALEVYNTNTDFQKQSSASDKGFQGFVYHLCSSQPRAALNSLPILLQYLETDSYTIRNGVLAVAYDLLVWTWDQIKNTEARPEDGEAHNNETDWFPERQNLLNEILLRHLKDINSHVRSKALFHLSELLKGDDRRVTNEEAVLIMKHVRMRLLDKAVQPRKNATALVVELVNNFPFTVSTTESFERKINQKRQQIVSTIENDVDDPATALYFIIKEFHLHLDKGNFFFPPSYKQKISTPDAAIKLIDEALQEKQYWQACEVLCYSLKKWSALAQQLEAVGAGDDAPEKLYLIFFKKSYNDIFPEDYNTLELDELTYVAPASVVDCRDFIWSLQCYYRMKVELDQCQPSLRKLLELGTTTDKKDAIVFYATICGFGYEPPHAIIVSIINAISQLTSVELTEFVEPFRKIFFGGESLNAAFFAKKLISLVDKLSETHVESLSGMIGELYRSRLLTAESIKCLWDAYSLSTGGWMPKDSRSAAYLLGIVGQMEKNIVTSNLTQLIEIGLSQRGLEDYELAKVTLQTILFGCRVEPEFVEPEVPKGRSKAAKVANLKGKSAEEIKFPPTHDMFPKIVELIENGLRTEGDNLMDAMYPRVVELSVQIIYRMCTDPSDIVNRFLPNVHDLVFTTEENASPFKTSEKILFRYMSLGRAILGAHINYFEQTVSEEIKRRKTILTKAKKKDKTTNRRRGARETLGNTSTSNSSILNQSNNDAASEMELMIGNIGFDSEADTIKTYVSKLLDTGFFRQFRVHVLYLCQVFKDIKSLNLKVACVQALAKLMLVCEASVIKSIDTLIKLWQENESVAVKLEIIRASVRLSVRFPNQMEKMNQSISTGLADKDPRIRKACMDYIQYLALSDLLKVREQLSDTVACLCDESQELREMAKDFINEISEKDNILQNSIPDIISRLSTREDITQEDFRGIMKTLLTKIKKEKQLVGLVERIVGRFRGPISIRVAQDTAYCLTQVQQNDKTFKILKDNISAYADKLGDKVVWEHICEVTATIKKLNKPELKTKIDEWEKEVEEHKNKCVALLEAENAGKQKEKPQRMVESESSEDEEEEQANVEDQENMDIEDNAQEAGTAEKDEDEAEESDKEQEGDYQERGESDADQTAEMDQNEGSDDEQMEVASVSD